VGPAKKDKYFIEEQLYSFPQEDIASLFSGLHIDKRFVDEQFRPEGKSVKDGIDYPAELPLKLVHQSLHRLREQRVKLPLHLIHLCPKEKMLLELLPDEGPPLRILLEQATYDEIYASGCELLLF
jgi:hypothetical protein